MELYESVFGSPLPTANIHESSLLKPRGPVEGKSDDINVDLQITLEDLYHSEVKTVRYSRIGLSPSDHRSTVQEEREIHVELERGWNAGGKVRLTGSGHQTHPKLSPGDLVIQLVLVPHLLYTLKSTDCYDIFHVHGISLPEAMTGVTLDLLSLGGREHSIVVTGPITEGHRVTIPHRGLFKDEETRGDLVISFRLT